MTRIIFLRSAETTAASLLIRRTGRAEIDSRRALFCQGGDGVAFAKAGMGWRISEEIDAKRPMVAQISVGKWRIFDRW
jgi:hypothetical protein